MRGLQAIVSVASCELGRRGLHTSHAPLCGCREGDLVTITDRNDLQVALKEVVEQGDRLAAQHGGPKLPGMLPPLRIQATRAKSEVSPCAVLPCTKLYSSRLFVKT